MSQVLKVSGAVILKEKLVNWQMELRIDQHGDQLLDNGQLAQLLRGVASDIEDGTMERTGGE